MDRISFAIMSYVQRETYKSMINYSDSFTISITEVNAALQFDWRWPLHRLCLGTIFVNLLFWVRLHNRRFPTISYCVRSGEWIKSCMTRGFIKWWRLLSNSLILMFVLRCSWSWFDAWVVQDLRTQLCSVCAYAHSRDRTLEFIYLWHFTPLMIDSADCDFVLTWKK